MASLKIEGRLRSANYVDNVVKAYRCVMDAKPADYAAALEEAGHLINKAMSRKVTGGYFLSPQPADAITPYHSGNLGLHLGRVEQSRVVQGGRTLRLTLKEHLAAGDRIRLHVEPSGERVAHTLKTLLAAGREQERCGAGEEVEFAAPAEMPDGWKYVDVYKIDVASAPGGAPASLSTSEVKKELALLQKRAGRHLREVKRRVGEAAGGAESGKDGRREKMRPVRPGGTRQKGKTRRLGVEWWLKTDSVRSLMARLPVNPDRYMITVNRQNVNQAGQLQRVLDKKVRDVVWCLPPIIVDRDRNRYLKLLQQLQRTGFRTFQLAHLSQMMLFGDQRLFLMGDYTLNLANSQALLTAAEIGLEAVQLCIESDRDSLLQAIRGYKQTHLPPSQKGGGNRSMRLGLTVYGAPPLFTSRMDAPFFPYDRPIISPKQESFVIRKGDGVSQTFPVRPFSLLPYLQDMSSLGLDYVVVDMTGGHSGKKEMLELADRLQGTGKVPKLPTFNYLGKLE